MSNDKGTDSIDISDDAREFFSPGSLLLRTCKIEGYVNCDGKSVRVLVNELVFILSIVAPVVEQDDPNVVSIKVIALGSDRGMGVLHHTRKNNWEKLG